MNYHWMHKLSAILFVVLCFEVGLFLIVFPWLEAWRLNSLAGFSPEWSTLWMNFHFRGAVSGLGLINLYISIAEAFRLRRFAPQPATSAAAPADEAIDHND
ncbi:MAG: hypothetical protein OHK0021_07820 [Bryobacter sp.]